MPDTSREVLEVIEQNVDDSVDDVTDGAMINFYGEDMVTKEVQFVISSADGVPTVHILVRRRKIRRKD